MPYLKGLVQSSAGGRVAVMTSVGVIESWNLVGVPVQTVCREWEGFFLSAEVSLSHQRELCLWPWWVSCCHAFGTGG